jgi:hypothetical protein
VAKFVACTLHRANLMLYTAAQASSPVGTTRSVMIERRGHAPKPGARPRPQAPNVSEGQLASAGVAIKADKLAAQGAYGGAAIAGVAAVASLFTGGAVGGGGGGVNSIARRVRLPTRAQTFRSHFTAVRITKNGCGTPYLSE